MPTETANLAQLAATNAKELLLAANARTDGTFLKELASKYALLEPGETVKKKSATNAMTLAKSVPILLPPTPNTALKVSSLTELPALKPITAELDLTLTPPPENALFARFLSVNHASISTLAMFALMDILSILKEDALKPNLSSTSFLRHPSSFPRLPTDYSDLLKFLMLTTTLRELVSDLAPFLTLSS